MKHKVRKCLQCLKPIASGTKVCPHCQTVLKYGYFARKKRELMRFIASALGKIKIG